MNRTITFLLLLHLSFSGLSQKFDVQWAVTQSGIGEDFTRSNFVDSLGNVYAVGYFSNIVDFDPSEKVVERSSRGGRDAFIAKFSATGDIIWVKTVSSTDHDMGEDVFVDNEFNIYFTGSFNGTITDFDGTGIDLISNGLDDVFIIKMDRYGNLLWARSFGGAGIDEPEAVSVDASGNVYNVGRFFYTVDFDPGPGTYNIASKGGWDYYVVKIDRQGDFVWARGLGGSSNDYVLDIETEPNGNIVMVGNYQRTVDFDPSLAQDLRTSGGARDLWVTKWDPDATMLWTKTYGGIGDDWLRVLGLDKDGVIYCAGEFSYSMQIDESTQSYSVVSDGSTDGFIHKISPDGETIWLKRVGGNNADRIWGLDVDLKNNVYVSGEFYSTTLGYDQGGITTGPNNGESDVFIMKVNENADLIWLETGGSVGTDWARGVHADKSGSIYLTGSFEREADFSFGANENVLNAVAANDGYIIKLSQCLVNKYYDIVVSCKEFTWMDSITYTRSVQANYYEHTGDCDTLHHLYLRLSSGSLVGADYFYPNPSNGQFMLRMDEHLRTVRVYNVLGQLLFKGINMDQEPLELYVPSGVYIAVFETDCQTSTQKLIVSD